MSIKSDSPLLDSMKKVMIIFLFLPYWGFSQSAEDDDLTFQSAVDWLDRKLNYYYFEDGSQKWWLNKFYVNEKREVTIKNIHTAKPRSANIKEKVYHIRKFNIEDINAYNIKISEIKQNQGRIVKGKLLELHTFGNKRVVHNTTDGRRGSDVSFIQLSFPTFMTDSIADYAELVQSKFKEAIIAATKVYASESIEENKKAIFNILKGSFVSKDGERIKIESVFENVISLNETPTEKVFFGFNDSSETFYITKISSEGSETKNYELQSGETILLQNKVDKGDVIVFETIHSFRLSGTNFYRE